MKNSSGKRRKKKILRNPVRNIFLDPKNKFLKTGIGNLVLTRSIRKKEARVALADTVTSRITISKMRLYDFIQVAYSQPLIAFQNWMEA